MRNFYSIININSFLKILQTFPKFDSLIRNETYHSLDIQIRVPQKKKQEFFFKNTSENI